MASLDTVPLTGPGAQAFNYTVGVPAGGVQAFQYVCRSGASSEASFVYQIQTSTSYCWDAKAQRLLDYLGKPFQKALTSVLGSLMRTFGRELSACTETVTLTGTSDARGIGNFSVEVRFEPISAVNAVQRVDANGTVLETYTVTSYDGRTISLSGVQTPRQGDLLLATYSYTQEGLEVRVTQALSELNILTATGDFLDRWGGLFNVPRIRTGKYGTEQYGGGKYGTAGTEADGSYGRRIVNTVIASRNSKTAILAAVQRITGGSPYIVEWVNGSGHRGFVFRPTGTAAWSGGTTETATQYHLIWGRTARFIKEGVNNGGAFVFEVWVPSGSGLTVSQLLSVVNALKPAGSKAYIRYYS